jgi:hypothetical protein
LKKPERFGGGIGSATLRLLEDGSIEASDVNLRGRAVLSINVSDTVRKTRRADVALAKGRGVLETGDKRAWPGRSRCAAPLLGAALQQRGPVLMVPALTFVGIEHHPCDDRQLFALS